MKAKTTYQIVRLTEKHTDRKDFDSAKWNRDHDKLYSTEWFNVDELCIWLQETFGNMDNINLILNEIGRCRKK